MIEPSEILDNYGIDATRIFMISDSPPDRELEWTDEGIQSSKNLTNRIERYFLQDKTQISEDINKSVEKFVFEMETNISKFNLNKCIANIYTLLNLLEKNKTYIGNHYLGKKILICLLPIIPRLSSYLIKKLFNTEILDLFWPDVDQNLIIDDNINLPIQIKGKLISTINTKKGYNENNLLNEILKIKKVKKKIDGKKIAKVINVQDKIINIITN